MENPAITPQNNFLHILLSGIKFEGFIIDLTKSDLIGLGFSEENTDVMISDKIKFRLGTSFLYVYYQNNQCLRYEIGEGASIVGVYIDHPSYAKLLFSVLRSNDLFNVNIKERSTTFTSSYIPSQLVENNINPGIIFNQAVDYGFGGFKYAPDHINKRQMVDKSVLSDRLDSTIIIRSGVPEDFNNSIEILIKRANSFLNLGMYDDAVAFYDIVLQSDHGNIEALYNRGIAISRKLNQYDEYLSERESIQSKLFSIVNSSQTEIIDSVKKGKYNTLWGDIPVNLSSHDIGLIPDITREDIIVNSILLKGRRGFPFKVADISIKGELYTAIEIPSEIKNIRIDDSKISDGFNDWDKISWLESKIGDIVKNDWLLISKNHMTDNDGIIFSNIPLYDPKGPMDLLRESIKRGTKPMDFTEYVILYELVSRGLGESYVSFDGKEIDMFYRGLTKEVDLIETVSLFLRTNFSEIAILKKANGLTGYRTKALLLESQCFFVHDGKLLLFSVGPSGRFLKGGPFSMDIVDTKTIPHLYTPQLSVRSSF